MRKSLRFDLFLKTSSDRSFLLKSRIKISSFLTGSGVTGPGSSVGRVSASGNGRSRVRSRAATYQSRKKVVLAAPRLALRLTGQTHSYQACRFRIQDVLNIILAI